MKQTQDRLQREADMLLEQMAVFRHACLLHCHTEEQRGAVNASYIAMLAALRSMHGAPLGGPVA